MITGKVYGRPKQVYELIVAPEEVFIRVASDIPFKDLVVSRSRSVETHTDAGRNVSEGFNYGQELSRDIRSMLRETRNRVRARRDTVFDD
jgi:hypothetical protein